MQLNNETPNFTDQGVFIVLKHVACVFPFQSASGIHAQAATPSAFQNGIPGILMSVKV